MSIFSAKILKTIHLRKNKDNKIGLCLGGGGARGFVHIGAIKAFEEYGLKFDYVTGTSVGSLVGAFYAAGMNYQQLYDIAKTIDMKEIRTNVIPYKSSKTDGLEKVIIDNLGDINIEDLKIPFIAVATNLKTTKECCITKGNLAKAVAASCCIPYVFYPVELKDKILVDGGLMNTIPADIAKLNGCDYVVGVDAHKERTYGTENSKLINVLTCCFRILMQNNVRKGYEYADVMLTPSTKNFKMLKIDKFDELIEEGYNEAIDKMPEILMLFNKKPLSKKQKVKFLLEYKRENELEII